jgi:hypothetical protein
MWMLFPSLMFCAISCFAEVFISSHAELEPYLDRENVLMVASPGRSGSMLLTEILTRDAPQYEVIKSHLLPPSKKFLGKIIFIYSDPNVAAESTLHMCMDESWARSHFRHVESSDRPWLKRLKSKQTKKENLLMYDALGFAKQLSEWLEGGTKMADEKSARILAVKYEHLWDPEIQDKIKVFLDLEQFHLPEKKSRGVKTLSLEEREMRKQYNLGSPSAPRYAAYDKAREIWANSPPHLFLKLR